MVLEMKHFQVILLATALTGASPAGADVGTCRTALLTELDAMTALTECDTAVQGNPSDPVARLLRAAARIAAIASEPAVDNLLDDFGFAEEGRFPPGSAIWPPGGLDSSSPTGVDVQAVVSSTVLLALDMAAADLAAITAPFTLLLTSDEMQALGITSVSPIEVDRSDALLLRSLVEALRSILLIGVAYDLDFDIDDAVARFSESLDIQNEIVEVRPSLLSLRPGGADRMALAKLALCSAVDDYHRASAAIRDETDDQSDDLIALADPGAERNLSLEFARLRRSLDQPARVLVGSQPWKESVRNALHGRLGMSFGPEGVTLDLQNLFDSPASLRPLAPVFSFDFTNRPPSQISGFPDASFGGALSATEPDPMAISATPCPQAVPEAGALGSGLVAAFALGVITRVRVAARRGRAPRCSGDESG